MLKFQVTGDEQLAKSFPKKEKAHGRLSGGSDGAVSKGSTESELPRQVSSPQATTQNGERATFM